MLVTSSKSRLILNNLGGYKMQTYIALGTDNKPLLNGKMKTVKQWKFYGNKFNTLKKFGFITCICIVSPEVSLRDFEYVRINYGKKC